MRVRLGDIDEITLDVTGTVIERIDVSAADPPAGPAVQDASEEDDDEVAGPIAIAVDMGEADVVAGDNPAS